MTSQFDAFLQQAWADHADHSAAVAERLRTRHPGAANGRAARGAGPPGRAPVRRAPGRVRRRPLAAGCAGRPPAGRRRGAVGPARRRRQPDAGRDRPRRPRRLHARGTDSQRGRRGGDQPRPPAHRSRDGAAAQMPAPASLRCRLRRPPCTGRWRWRATTWRGNCTTAAARAAPAIPRPCSTLPPPAGCTGRRPAPGSKSSVPTMPLRCATCRPDCPTKACTSPRSAWSACTQNGAPPYEHFFAHEALTKVWHARGDAAECARHLAAAEAAFAQLTGDDQNACRRALAALQALAR